MERGRPRNPFITAGAIVTTDAVLEGATLREALGALLRFVRAAAEDEAIHINDRVAASETATGHRNFALAHYLRSHDNLSNPPLPGAFWSAVQRHRASCHRPASAASTP